jgi:hypothetical protein
MTYALCIGVFCSKIQEYLFGIPVEQRRQISATLSIAFEGNKWVPLPAVALKFTKTISLFFVGYRGTLAFCLCSD